ncbi:hypothetical protein A8M60_19325 [Nocardia farcinica]|nr:hypothetical protein A8M60_19325 [Nocardia farcinica]PZT88511.1 MAG: hypothetical protein DI630_33150 [Gordonia sp. (in: high G+C Gram-positive bacteria)]
MSGSVAVHIRSTSQADDLGLIALRDVCVAAGRAVQADYRIIGGHMVRLLTHVYGRVPEAPRLTADADAGINEPVAAGGVLGSHLEEVGYRQEFSNRYVRAVPVGDAAVDLLVPAAASAGPQELGGNQFDAAPGLRLALAAPAVIVEVSAWLSTGEEVACTAVVPDLEAAVVLKLLATTVRSVPKDIADLHTLLGILEATDEPITGPWMLVDPYVCRRGERLDAARAAQRLRGLPPRQVPPHCAALMRKHIAEVSSRR